MKTSLFPKTALAVTAAVLMLGPLSFDALQAKQKPAPAPPAEAAKPSPRSDYASADLHSITVADMPNARFWGDDTEKFEAALPGIPGEWLILSAGGSDGAFGAGYLVGLSSTGRRPNYSVVTGVSTGALMAPFVFAGPDYDRQLRANYTLVTPADVFELGNTGESLLDTWPLKKAIAKQITPELLKRIAAQHNEGRRLFIVTTQLDAGRSVVWNMGQIAADGGPQALELFRAILLASSSIPGVFPPVLIDAESNGKRLQEMHSDGAIFGPFYAGPIRSTDIKASRLHVLINAVLNSSFDIMPRETVAIMSRAVTLSLKRGLVWQLDRLRQAAQEQHVPIDVITPPTDFDVKSNGPFDEKYMAALFEEGYRRAASATCSPSECAQSVHLRQRD